MKHEFINVGEIFNKYKVIYVPYYQREYVWGQKNDGRNLYKFIDDIFTQYRDNPSSEYFIGTLAFCSAEVNDVIDGQQRITSLILILSLLSRLKCSEKIKEENLNLLNPEEGKFVIQERYYLTEELKKNLGLPNNFNSQGHNVDISKTIDKITSQIENAWSGYQTSWYDGLYNYILEKVKLISLEYNNISESLKYFLNINSLSIQLTQSDIFYSILSQAIRLSKTQNNIFDIKQEIAYLSTFKGLSKQFDEYKAYDDKDEYGINNIIYIFIKAYYQNDCNILALNEVGVGKWMSFCKNDVFTDAIIAKDFTEKFIQYLKDFETIYKYFSNTDGKLDKKSSLYISWTLLQYEAYDDVLKVLIDLFRIRQNYIDGNGDLYSQNSKEISPNILNEIAKRLNLTLLNNYIKNATKRTVGFIENISLNVDNSYKKTINDILTDIPYEDIFNLNYNDKKSVSNFKTKDFSRLTKVILSCQESYLDKTADSDHSFGEYLQDLLKSENFSIEHLYSVKEYSEKARLDNWKNKKSKFLRPEDFDAERFKFENLSLLDKQMNSSIGDDEIKNKLAKYKTARKVLGSNWEYLIQSLVDDSEYYRSQKIKDLGLPERKLVEIDQNTWELSENNREFNIKLLKLALKEIVSCDEK